MAVRTHVLSPMCVCCCCCCLRCRVDVGMLHEELQTIGDMLQQSVSVIEHWALFADCDHCVTAFSG